MAYKRALWSSGFTYKTRCPRCGNNMEYTDKMLDFRPWYPNGFVYCTRCREPMRHEEFFAVDSNGNRVYNTVAEADLALKNGYYASLGYTPDYAQRTVSGQTADYTPPAESDPKADAEPENRFCPDCGKRHEPGQSYCAGCGRKLN